MIKHLQTKKGFTQHYVKNSAGFTLIETLVAITVLLAAIAGSLAINSKGLLVSTNSRNQMTAYFLAQDAMEYVKNIKDTNMSNGTSWLSGIGTCSAGHPCGVSSMLLPSSGGVRACPLITIDCPVYINDTGYQQRSATSQKTFFSRKFFLENTGNNRERKIVVVVSWKEVAVPYEVRLVNYIFEVSL